LEEKKMFEADSKQQLMEMLADIRSRLEVIEGGLTGTSVPTKSKQRAKMPAPLVLPPIVPPELDPDASIADRIQHVLSREALSVDQIAKVTKLASVRVSQEVAKLFKSGHLISVMGRGDATQYRWSTSPNLDAVARREAIKQLLMKEPMTQRMIRAALKTQSPVVVDRDIVEIRRKEPIWIMNPGVDGHRHEYYLFPNRATPPGPQPNGERDSQDGRYAAKVYKPKDPANYKPQKRSLTPVMSSEAAPAGTKSSKKSPK
jgi:hypothetical protein